MVILNATFTVIHEYQAQKIMESFQCDRIMLEGEERELADSKKRELEEEYLKMAKRGERVLAYAFRKAGEVREYKEHFIFLVFSGALDPARPEAKETINRCYRTGIKANGDDHRHGSVPVRNVLGW